VRAPKKKRKQKTSAFAKGTVEKLEERKGKKVERHQMNRLKGIRKSSATKGVDLYCVGTGGRGEKRETMQKGGRREKNNANWVSPGKRGKELCLGDKRKRQKREGQLIRGVKPQPSVQ